MTPPEHLTSLSRDELLALVVEQQRQITELTAVIETLCAEDRTAHARREAPSRSLFQGDARAQGKAPWGKGWGGAALLPWAGHAP